jgi:NADPH-dependent curcumin reductase CurA
MSQNKALIFNEVPEGMPEYGKHLIIKDIGFDLSAVPPKGAILKIKFASFDPYLRGRMRNKIAKSYFDAFDLHKPIETGLIGEVIKSGNETLKVGNNIRTFGPLQEYWAITPGMMDQLNPVTSLPLVEHLANPHNADLTEFLGALGMPGITAYSSFYEIGKP